MGIQNILSDLFWMNRLAKQQICWFVPNWRFQPLACHPAKPQLERWALVEKLQRCSTLDDVVNPTFDSDSFPLEYSYCASEESLQNPKLELEQVRYYGADSQRYCKTKRKNTDFASVNCLIRCYQTSKWASDFWLVVELLLDFHFIRQ